MTNTPHPHLENMRLFLKDAEVSDQPQEFWQVRNPNAKDKSWRDLGELAMPSWHKSLEYRRKPQPRWFNVYRLTDSEGLFLTPPVGLSSKAIADACAGKSRVACIKLTLDEGEFHDE